MKSHSHSVSRRLAIAFVVLGVSTSATASAQRPPPAGKQTPPPAAPAPAGPNDDICKRILCVPETTIVGRVQKPFALAEVSRIAPKLTLAELRQPFLDRIEEAIVHDPF
jgi:hypothetical protein